MGGIRWAGVSISGQSNWLRVVPSRGDEIRHAEVACASQGVAAWTCAGPVLIHLHAALPRPGKAVFLSRHRGWSHIFLFPSGPRFYTKIVLRKTIQPSELQEVKLETLALTP